MSTTAFALIFGILFTFAGIAAMFAANVLLSAIYIVTGVAGLVAATAEHHARRYARAVAVIYGGLAVIGMLPPLNTLFGLIPIHGYDVWLHLGSAAIAAYFGWRADIPVLNDSDDRRHGMADRRHVLNRVALEQRRGAYDRRMPLGS